MANVLRDAGWSTFWVGKNHNVPVDAVDDGRRRRRTGRSAQGYDRFYGFIGGETNNWYPDLDRGQPLRRPALPARGRLPPVQGPRRQGAADSSATPSSREPDKPWYLWFCPGANHAPHHAPQEYIDQVQGRMFDDGYEAYREWVLAADDRARASCPRAPS